MLTSGLSAFAASSGHIYRRGEILIKLKGPTGRAHAAEQNQISQTFFDKVSTTAHISRIKSWNGMSLHHVRYDTTTGKSMAEVLADLSAMPEVQYAEPNYIVTKSEIAQSEGVATYTSSQVQEMSGGGYPMTSAPIQLTSTWPTLSTGLAKVVVAVIDTGLDLTHPAFANSIWTNPGEIPGNGIDDDQDGFVDDVHGWNFAYANNTPQDDEGHGTHVSGIVLGQGQNIYTTPAPATSNVMIMPLKFLDSTGSGSTSDAISAIYYAISKALAS